MSESVKTSTSPYIKRLLVTKGLRAFGDGYVIEQRIVNGECYTGDGRKGQPSSDCRESRFCGQEHNQYRFDGFREKLSPQPARSHSLVSWRMIEHQPRRHGGELLLIIHRALQLSRTAGPALL